MDMRTSKYSEEQIIGFLCQAEAGMPIKEIGRKHGFSDASFYKWRSKYGGMEVSEGFYIRVRRHKHLDQWTSPASIDTC
jgi:putative transposase